MATQAQILANRANAQRSTGPQTEPGKARSARNRLALGLYTHTSYVRPDEIDLYAEYCEKLRDELAPGNLFEETLAAEIVGASWRLRRCAAADAELPNDFTETTDKTRRSIERARAAAHTVLHRSLNQLRKLQTERLISERLASNCNTAVNSGESAAQSASNCKTAPQIARNAPCPCRSGEKYKRCCGKNAPPVLGRAA